MIFPPSWVVTTIAILGIAAAGGTLVWRYKNAQSRAEAAEKDAAYWKAEFGVETEVRKQREREWDEAESARKKLGSKYAALGRSHEWLLGKFKTLEPVSPDVAAWAAAPVPDAVRRLRREAHGCSADLSVPCAGGAAPSDGGAPDAGRIEPRVAPGGGGAPRRAAGQQL